MDNFYPPLATGEEEEEEEIPTQHIPLKTIGPFIFIFYFFYFFFGFPFYTAEDYVCDWYGDRLQIRWKIVVASAKLLFDLQKTEK